VWYAKRPEVMTISRELKENPARAFQTISDTKMSWEVINSRHGDVMGVNTILKSDHFPGCQRMSLLPHITGAPNYRQVDGLCVYGVAIPTIEGMKNTIGHLLKTSNTETIPKKVLWISLREEPVVYINQRPFVLRNYDSPFNNLEYTGIDTARVEEMEVRLKRDILNEAGRYEGKFLIHDENNDGKTFEAWEPVNEETVMTPREVYKRLGEEGFPVSYVRVAITDEQSPEEADFDSLVRLIQDTDRTTTGIVFNCQMGRGRTSTGMVITTLYDRIEKSDGPQGDTEKVHSAPSTPSQNPLLSSSGGEEDVNAAYHRGEYRIILRLMRILPGGPAIKTFCDVSIDMCQHMQNLREDILGCKERAEAAKDELNREIFEVRGQNYLKRYFYLIVFTAYLQQQFKVGKFNLKFVEWMAERPEITSLLESIDLNH